jgi:hypothetical protein
VIPVNDTNAVGQPTLALLRDIIATVLDVTISSWSHLLTRKEVNAKSSEPDIAGRLGGAMIAEKNRRNLKNFRIEEEVGTRSSLNAPRTEGRIDIKIIYSFDEREYFGIECKRVSGKSKALAKKYIDQGVMRFVTGKYSPNHEWGAMLGFVIDGDADGCINLVRSYLTKTHKTNCMMDKWEIVKNFISYQHLYRTSHRQTIYNSPVTILHLFLTIA